VTVGRIADATLSYGNRLVATPRPILLEKVIRTLQRTKHATGVALSLTLTASMASAVMWSAPLIESVAAHVAGAGD
jgi:hypothetical protein